MRQIFSLAVASAIGLASSAMATTIYPTNDGFELPDLGGGGGAYAYQVAGATWAWVGGTGEAANGSGFNVIGASNGNVNGGATSTAGQAAFIQGGDGTLGSTGSSFSQTVTLPAGVATLNFDDEWRTFNQGPNGIVVYLDGVEVSPSLTPASDTSFGPQSANLGTVTAGPHVIAFAGNNTIGGDKTSFIDNVSITVTPEPASLGLIGLGAVGLMARRRRA